MEPSFFDLRYFIDVAETKNISRAAERLGITQPTLSQAIRRLEDAMGLNLLIRSKKGVELTAAGKRVNSHARLMLSSWEDLKRHAMADQQEVTGVVKFGCHTSVALYSVSQFLPKLLGHHPGLEIRFQHDLSRHITAKVIGYELDMALVINPVAHPDLVIHHLAEDLVTIWGRESQHDVLIFNPEMLQAQSILKKMKLKYRREIHTDSLELATSLALSGAGHAIIPTRVVHEHGRGKLNVVPNAGKFQDDICLIYRFENKNLKTIEALTTAIKKIF